MSVKHFAAQDVESYMAMQSASEPLPLLKTAAHEAFYKLNVTFLKQLATHFHVQLDGKNTLYQVLEILVKHFAEPKDDEELFTILSKRIVKSQGEAEDLHINEKDMQETVDSSDLNTFEQLEVSLKKKQAETADFKKEISKLFKKVRPMPKPAAKKRAGRSHGAGSQSSRHKPTTALDIEEAKALVPPGMQVGKDHLRGRWWTRDSAIGFSCERSWARWGDCGAFALCAEAAWAAIDSENPCAWLNAMAKELSQPVA
eukprot:11203594-Lingulodinium_polyedra.AAC.2